MPKIILTRGIQGSGKSTWSKKWAEEDPEHRVRWNNNDFRRMLGKYWVPKREVIVSSTELHFINYAMCYGYDIVIDNMNLNPKYYEFVKKIIEDFNYMVTESEQYTIVDFIDWLNKNHFDYRGLIEKGLAIEAPKDMYKNQQ